MGDVFAKIGQAILEHAPEAAPKIFEALAGQGIDLGPMTPDIRADFAKVRADIDAQLELVAREKTDPAPGPIPRESER